MAQLLSVLMVTMVVGLFSDGLHLAISAGYGTLIMLAVNALLARRIRAWSQPQRGDGPKCNAIVTAGGRFVFVVVLLVAASFAGLWLPAVAGGMLVAQIAVYLAGFWLLVVHETKKRTKGETL